jgi:hypothetical protein
MCGAHACLGIRIRDAGCIYMYSADALGFWGCVGSQLVPLPRYAYLIRLGILLSNPSPITDKGIGNSGDQELSSAQ